MLNIVQTVKCSYSTSTEAQYALWTIFKSC